jgi:hypothetical protein
MNLSEAILVAMEKAAPPGKSGWSVEKVPVVECVADKLVPCVHAKWSSFYGTWVRTESKAAAVARYRKVAESLAAELEGSSDPAGEAGRVVGIAVNESGFREDIQFGRGRSGRTKKTDKQYDDADGQGRGPSNEACLMQILPSMATKYGGPEKLLGDSDEALRLCFRAGLGQLRYSKVMCPTSKRTYPGPTGPVVVSELYATVAHYGTGSSCTSANDGKTEKRVHTVEWVTVVIRNAMSKTGE